MRRRRFEIESNLALTVFLFILAAFLLVGLLAARKVKHGSASDLIVAGRSLPQWIALLTMTATWVDGGYLLGTAEGAFKTNVASGAQGGLCFGFSLVIGGISGRQLTRDRRPYGGHISFTLKKRRKGPMKYATAS